MLVCVGPIKPAAPLALFGPRALRCLVGGPDGAVSIPPNAAGLDNVDTSDLPMLADHGAQVSPGTHLGTGAVGSLICASRRRVSSSLWYRVGCSVRPKQATCLSVPWGEAVPRTCRRETRRHPVGAVTISLLEGTHWRVEKDGALGHAVQAKRAPTLDCFRERDGFYG